MARVHSPLQRTLSMFNWLIYFKLHKIEEHIITNEYIKDNLSANTIQLIHEYNMQVRILKKSLEKDKQTARNKILAAREADKQAKAANVEQNNNDNFLCGAD